MSDDDDFMDDVDPSNYEDYVAQRAASFVLLARFADSAIDSTAKELTFTMMRKVSASIKTPSTADVVTLTGGKSLDK